MKNKIYLIGNFTKSLDSYHFSKGFIHLIGSIFYTNNLDLNKLKEIKRTA